MRYNDLSDIGGFLYWLLIKRCKTNLSDEKSKDKWARNIFILLFVGTILGFLIFKIDDLRF